MINRRGFVQATAVVGTLGMVLKASADAPAKADLDSPLIYVSPMTSSGGLSRCQAEVWFAAVGGGLYVVTDKSAWRAEAVRRGLSKAQIWVGDVGEWDDADGRYKQLPGGVANASLETDAGVHARVLEAMGGKYQASGWGSWGPRFKSGLNDGSRAMVKYTFA